MSDKAILRVLTKARSALVRYGWTQRRYGHKDIGFCTMGAIRYATGSTRFMQLLHVRSGFGAADEITKVVGLYGVEEIPNWNDRDWRSVQEVIDVFDAAIVAVGERIEARK